MFALRFDCFTAGLAPAAPASLHRRGQGGLPHRKGQSLGVHALGCGWDGAVPHSSSWPLPTSDSYRETPAPHLDAVG